MIKGRRRPDMPDHSSVLPDDLRPGDYWRVCVQHQDDSITWEWWVKCPNGMLGRLGNHTVEENEDGTITIMPNQERDGHMNSILVQSSRGESWHGWVKNGWWGEDHNELSAKFK